ncbi:MAG: class A beta-lactamase-related serine hydrolase [Tildeniella torsiva UHER 1998/13D]|jgi:hypothetical protein|nr:class A beta-lactamase-related serine hydrolase [Tildeniella torsiva UHER 1998/13D]
MQEGIELESSANEKTTNPNGTDHLARERQTPRHSRSDRLSLLSITKANDSPAFFEQSTDNFYAKINSLLLPSRSPNLVVQDNKVISLQQILDGVLLVLASEDIPVENISISLTDLNSEKCCNYSGFQDKQKRYPASLVKLFWAFMLKDLQDSSSLHNNSESLMNITIEDERKMLYESDNNSASKILDAISGTTSSKTPLSESEFLNWAKKRMSVNEYFYKEGYSDVNVTQKTFPIPSLEIYEPIGPDLQFREVLIDAQEPPQRNYLTSFDVSKLLLNLSEGTIISQEVSSQIKQNLLQDHTSVEIRSNPYNPIVGFFGERLPEDARVFTKIGFTESDGRQEAAIIESHDQQTRFILVVFANDPIFSQKDSAALPLIAEFVYSQMNLRSMTN